MLGPLVVALHYVNPAIAPRFEGARKSREELTALAIDFFTAGLSGQPVYAGLSMPAAATAIEPANFHISPWRAGKPDAIFRLHHRR